MPYTSPLNGKIVTLFNYGTGTVLDLDGGNAANGTPVIGFHDHNGDNQHWKIVQVGFDEVWPTFALQNVATDTRLDLLNGLTDNGTPLQGWAATPNNPHQIWYLISLDTEFNVVAIQNVASGTYADLYNGNPADKTPVNGWAGNPTTKNPHQLWRLKIVGSPE